MLQGTFKRIAELLYKDSRAHSELDYTEQSFWVSIYAIIEGTEMGQRQ
jgi:hypothetical protein